LGLLVSVLVSLVSLESYLVHFVRARGGKPLLDEVREASVPRPRALQRLRRAVRFLPFYRAFNPIEATLLALIAAVADTFTGDLGATRVLLVAVAAAAAVTVVGHLVAILSSDRLK
jgi:hypothetical protein